VLLLVVNLHIFIATRIFVNLIGDLNINNNIMKFLDFGKDVERPFAGSILGLNIS